MKTMNDKLKLEISQLKDRLGEAARRCQGRGAGQERSLFERLQGELQELTGEIVSERDARDF